MAINFTGQNNQYFVKMDMLSTKSKQDKKTVYVNPDLIELVEPASKAERTNASYALKDDNKLTESKLTLSSGREIYVDGEAREIASKLGGASKIEAHILDING